jgi:NAD-dependent deacetylase
MTPALIETLEAFARGTGNLTVLTGAGISAESGIPTFRGPEGYWTVGSREYQPQEMATYRMFLAQPDEVWKWYLYRMTVCRNAAPNPGHAAVVEMEKLFGDRFTLITQNVDGLHLRAGSSLERTYQIHGNIFFMRCAAACGRGIFPAPENLPPMGRNDALPGAVRAQLRCPACGGLARPHVLWFDETYDEVHFYLFSALEAARKTGLLLIVGTAGATNLPNQVARETHRRGGTLVDVNIEPTVFSAMAESSPGGAFLRGAGGKTLPAMVEVFKGALGQPPG